MASAENSVKYQGATWRVIVDGKEVQVYALDANGDMKEDSLVVSTMDKLPVGPNAPWLDVLKAVLKVGKSAEAAKKSYMTEAERFDGLKTYLLGLLDKGSKEKDQELHKMIDEVVKQRSSLEGFYKHFNK
jgi:hypothetical protein